MLGDDSFATLMYGLREGRRIVDNVQKGLVFLVSTHVALLGFILIATIYGFGQPLLPLQILWLELFIDLSTSVAFEREPAEPGLMRRPPRDRRIPLLSQEILLRITAAGGFSAVAALVDHGHAPRIARPHALACLHHARRRAGRAGIRQSQPDDPAPPPGAQLVPPARRAARRRRPGRDPAHPRRSPRPSGRRRSTPTTG